MSYFNEIDEWLDELLKFLPTDDDRDICKKEIKAKLLESYRNGKAAAGAAKPQRDNRARRHGR